MIERVKTIGNLQLELEHKYNRLQYKPQQGTILTMLMNLDVVEHRQQSLDFQPLRNVVNQCKASHH